MSCNWFTELFQLDFNIANKVIADTLMDGFGKMQRLYNR